MDGVAVTLTGVTEVGPSTVAVTLEAPAGFDARPGQFVQVRATVDGEPVTRHYSVSSPWVDDDFEVTVGVDPEGTLSPWLAAAAPGDAVEVAGPFGRVYYDAEPRVVVLAAGPGIGPAVGVAERAVAEGGDAAVVYLADHLVHEARLARLSLAGATVFVVGPGSFESAVDGATDGGQPFVYGFEPFVEVARVALENAGVDPGTAKVENFG